MASTKSRKSAAKIAGADPAPPAGARKSPARPKRKAGVQVQPPTPSRSPTASGRTTAGLKSQPVTKPPAAVKAKPRSRPVGRKSRAAASPKPATPARGPRAPVGKPLLTAAQTPSKTSIRIVPAAPEQKPPAASAVGAKPAAATPPAPLVEAKPRRERKPITLPPILLEGDAPSMPRPSGPGERYLLSPEPAAPRQVEPAPATAAISTEAPGPAAPEVAPLAQHQPARAALYLQEDLPESYGTERVFLTARDPHWLHVAWDLAPERQWHCNRMSRDGHLVVRAHVDDANGPVASEAQVHPESKSWFVHVHGAGTRYTCELGYYDADGGWHRVGTSDSAVTPRDTPVEAPVVEFATIPPEVTLEKVFEAVQEAVRESVPLIEAVNQRLPSVEPAREKRVERVAEAPQAVRPAQSKPPLPRWTRAQARALEEIVRVDDFRRVWVGSLEVTEMVRRHLQREITSPAPVMEAAELVAAPPPGPAPGEVSSPAAVPQPEVPEWERKFWFNLNAELVLYGATEPDATVTVDGRQIRLRPDGTFSYRFALPDGRYPLTLAAEAADGGDRRTAKLEFSRATTFDRTGVHPQDAALKPPVPSSMT